MTIKQTAAAATAIKSAADPTRLAVLDMLVTTKKEELMVSELNGKLGIEPTLLSHHLSILKKAKLIKSTRKGKQVSYKMNPAAMNGKGIKLGKFKLVWPGK